MPVENENPPPTESTPAEKPVRKRRPKPVAYEPYRQGVKVGGRTIGLGMAGDDVKRLQRMLNRRGENLVLDGVFGPLTETAVKKFQKSPHFNSLIESLDDPRGVVGRQTWAVLGW